MSHNPRACDRCQGAGTIRETQQNGGVYREALVTCTRCHGTGRRQ